MGDFENYSRQDGDRRMFARRRRPWHYVVILALAMAISVGALWSCGRAHAHSFYSAACCSGRDCAMALPGDVTWTARGYSVKSTGELIPANDRRIQHSPPGEPGYRLCVPPYDAKVRCLYVPEPES